MDASFHGPQGTSTKNLERNEGSSTPPLLTPHLSLATPQHVAIQGVFGVP